MSDIETFRAETRAWLEANCPPGARGLATAPENSVWGGRNPHWPSADQKLWLERMAERGVDRARMAEGIWRRGPRQT